EHRTDQGGHLIAGARPLRSHRLQRRLRPDEFKFSLYRRFLERPDELRHRGQRRLAVLSRRILQRPLLGSRPRLLRKFLRRQRPGRRRQLLPVYRADVTPDLSAKAHEFMRYALLAAMSLLPAVVAAQPTNNGSGPKKRDAVYAFYAAKPGYPYIARINHMEGSGVFLVDIRANGRVQSVEMVQSTGHPELDSRQSPLFRSGGFR